MESGGEVSKPKQERPGVGVAIITLSEDGRILIGKRLGSGHYGFPGGHLERYESWEETGSRELLEETSIDIPAKDLKFVTALNAVNEKDEYHYVVVFLVGKLPKDQEAKNTEPTKCGGWEWWSIEEIKRRKSELFYSIPVMLDQKDDIFNLEHLYSLLKSMNRVL